MAELILSFRAKASHGALVLRDVQAVDDVSDWDAASSSWHQEGKSLIFGVLPASEGLVDVEVWKGDPPAPLPVPLFEAEIPDVAVWLVVHDPDERVRMEFRAGRGPVRVVARGDDLKIPRAIQIAIPQ